MSTTIPPRLRTTGDQRAGSPLRNPLWVAVAAGFVVIAPLVIAVVATSGGSNDSVAPVTSDEVARVIATL